MPNNTEEPRIFSSNNMSWFMILILSILSWYATFDGFSNFFSNNSENNYLNLIIAGVFTAIVQIMIVVAIKFYKIGNEVKFLFIWFFCVLVSSGFGQSFYFRAAGFEQNYAEMKVDSALRDLQKQIEINKQILDAKIEATSQLNDYSIKQSKVEGAVGGTCGLENTSGQKGKRWRLRYNDQKLATAFNNQLLKIQQHLNKVSNKLSQTSTISEQIKTMELSVARINAMQKDQRILTGNKWLENRIEAGQGGILDKKTGSRFNCPDIEFDLYAKAALENNLQMVSMKNVHEITKGSHIVHAYTNLINIVSGNFMELNTLDFLSILIALAVDLYIVICLNIVGINNSNVSNAISASLKRFNQERLELIEGLMSLIGLSPTEVADIIVRHSKRLSNNQYLVYVPSLPNTESGTKIKKLMAQLLHLGLIKEVSTRPWDKWFMPKFDEKMSGDNNFIHYVLPKNLLDELSQANLSNHIRYS